VALAAALVVVALITLGQFSYGQGNIQVTVTSSSAGIDQIATANLVLTPAAVSLNLN